jgi:ACS family hexuronate transporter-like MFS transporter
MGSRVSNDTGPSSGGKFRWFICALIFFATTINYLDRAVISLLKSDLERIFQFTETDYANIVIAFQLSYAIGLLLAGRVIDQLGSKLGYALSMLFWSLSAVAHALVGGAGGFMAARAALGFSEAGNFPSAVKAVAEWFPQKERALATGIFNSGVNLGTILASLTVPFIAASFGWQWAFVATGLTGIVILALWWIYFDHPSRHPRLTAGERAYIESGQSVPQSDTKVPSPTASDGGENSQLEEKASSWLDLARQKAAWAFIFGKLLSDPAWWFYLFWLPAFLKAEYGLKSTDTAFPVALVFSISAVGSILGGWFPLYLVRRGWEVLKARRFAMLVYAVSVLPVVVVQWVGKKDMWLAVMIIGLATAAHAAWSANIFTTVSDRFHKKDVASVVGMGGMAGAAGGIIIAKLAGVMFDHFKALGHLETGYTIMFIICGCMYLLAWVIMQWLAPAKTR